MTTKNRIVLDNAQLLRVFQQLAAAGGVHACNVAALLFVNCDTQEQMRTAATAAGFVLESYPAAGRVGTRAYLPARVGGA